MVERVTELAKQPVDLALDTAPISGSLKDLVQIVNGHPQHVLTVSDFAAAAELGVRTSYGELHTARYDVVGDFAGYAATASSRFRSRRLSNSTIGVQLSKSARAGVPTAN